jgi:hypothetical protein
VNILLLIITVMLQQRLLDALDKWSKDQSTERTELLATFTEPVVAAIAAFAMLESSRMQTPPDSIRTRRKIMNKLNQFITAKDTRTWFAAISVMLHDAMNLLDKAVSFIDLDIDSATMKIAERIDVNVRYVQPSDIVEYLPYS